MTWESEHVQDAEGMLISAVAARRPLSILVDPGHFQLQSPSHRMGLTQLPTLFFASWPRLLMPDLGCFKQPLATGNQRGWN